MRSGHKIAASVIAALAALQNANSHAGDFYSDQPCLEVTLSGKITKKIFAVGTQEVVGLIVKLDDGKTAEVEIPKYNHFETYSGAEAKLQRLVKNGPKVQFRAIQCGWYDDPPRRRLELLP